ncbi:MAG: lysophospholipid acyltransferase family protein [Candidatus Omnitrophota bacterium]
MKIFNRFLARNGLKACLFLSGFLPYALLHFFIRTLVMIFYYSNSRLARNARESVDIAYGHEKTERHREDLVRQSFLNLARVMAEDIYYVRNSRLISSMAEINGEEHLKQALSKGKGVIATTAHLGNFALMIAWLAGYGCKVNVIMRPPRDSKMGDFIKQTVGKMGTHVIFTLPVRQCLSESIKALRNNEILFILLDQNYGADARIFVDFFGTKAATGGSPLTLASRTGASILPVFCLRGKDNRYQIEVEPEQILPYEPGNEESLRKSLQQLTSIIEAHIRRDPPLWSWMHKRWKSKNSRESEDILERK